VEIIGLGDLKPDPQNARKHTARYVVMVADALQEVGAARSIVIDEKGVVLARNATIKLLVKLDSLASKLLMLMGAKRNHRRVAGRFHGTYPPNYNEGTHLIRGKGPTRFQVVPFIL
jgi:hypothetical protein